jgi:gluconokinase
MRAQFFIVMGVAGCGKSTLGMQLADRLGWDFLEGDQLHPPANIDKMTHGVPLMDADRLPWLQAIADRIAQWRAAGVTGVVTCSSLRRSYRDIITAGFADVCFLYLRADRALITQRFAERRGHFMPASLIDSQFATLEEPGPDENVLVLEVARPIAALIETVVQEIGKPPHA